MADSDIDYTMHPERLVELLASDLASPLRAVAMGLAAEAQNRIAPYPEASRKQQAFKTLKQQRGFFAKLKSGAIRVPYPRSGDTLGRWSIRPIGAGAELVNTSPHAAWVHSATKQAKYHSGTWSTDKGIADQIVADGTAARMTEQALQAYFDRELGGNDAA